MERQGDNVTLRRCDAGQKVSLEESPYVMTMQQLANGKGGGAQ